jgi:hypothetical protein
MCGVITPLPNTPSLHGVQFKNAQEQLYLNLYNLLPVSYKSYFV